MKTTALKVTKLATAFFLYLVLLFNAATVQALGTSFNEVTVTDWGFVYTDDAIGGVTYLPGSYSFAAAKRYSVPEVDATSDPATGWSETYVYRDVTEASGEASTIPNDDSSTGSHGQLIATAIAQPVIGYAAESSALAYVEGSIEMSGSGTVKLYVDYELDWDLTTDGPLDSADGFGSMYVYLDGHNVPGGISGFNYYDLLVENGSDSSDTIQKKLEFGLYKFIPGITEAKTVDFKIQVNAVAGAASAVPEPATMILLGFGLLGLAGFGRKKFFKK